MRESTIIFRCSLVLVGAICVWSLLTFGPSVKADESSSQVAQEGKIGVPVRLKITSIGVDALIEKVGLAQDGSMGIPKKAKNTGWYEPGIRPGDIGSAVIDGHLNWYYGATGAFADLHKVRPGDIISVEDDTGIMINFIVRESRDYGANADTTDIFSSKDGKAHLNLITCGGTWNKKTQQYTKRLVIFADREIKS